MGSITAREKADIIDFIGTQAVFFEPGEIVRSRRAKKGRDTMQHLALFRAERI